MSKSRTVKTILPSTISREDAEIAFAAFAEQDAKQQKITSTMDVKITKIRDQYSDELTKLAEEKAKNFEIIQAYAENNRDDFSKKKSMELTHGTIGFRTGTPKLNKRKGFTWESIKNLVKEFMPQYIRTQEEVNKEKLLADRDEPKVAAQFAKIGVQVDQEETFFIDPKKELAEVA